MARQHLLLGNVLDLQSRGPPGEYFYVQLGDVVLLINAEDVFMEFVQELGLLLPLFLLGLVLFLTLKFLQELVVFNISLRETFLDQDLVDS